MTEQQAALLTLPVSTEQLSRIFLQADSETSALLLAARLNASQHGCASAACVSSNCCVQLLCAKVFTLFVAHIRAMHGVRVLLYDRRCPPTSSRCPYVV